MEKFGKSQEKTSGREQCRSLCNLSLLLSDFNKN